MAARVVISVIAASAIALVVLVMSERPHVELDADGQWWCSGKFCGTVSARCTSCTPLPRAACFHRRVVMSETEDDMCYSLMSFCEEDRAEALHDHDLDNIGACRVVSATVADQRSYGLHRGLMWLACGAFVFALLAALVARLGERQGRRAAQ